MTTVAVGLELQGVLQYLSGTNADAALCANLAWGPTAPYRTDSTITLTNGLATFVDLNAVAGDVGKALTGTGLTNQTVSTVVGTTITMSSAYTGTTGVYAVTFNKQTAKAATLNADNSPVYELTGALNAKAGTVGLGLNGACNALAGTTGLEAQLALRTYAGLP